MNPFDFIRHRNRWLYFTLIIGIGGLGSWITGAQHLQNATPTSGYIFCGNLGTFSISLAVMSLADHFVLSQTGFNLCRGLTLLLITAIAGVSGVIPLVKFDGWAVLASWIGFVSAALVWWGTHQNNHAFDNSDALSPMGGSIP